LKLRAIILQVGDNRKESGWAYVVLNSAQNLRAVRIGEIEYHYPQGLAAIAAQPGWAPLLGAWERLWTLPLHVALSLMVLQVFRRGSLRWLWLAILAHALVDLVAAGITPILQLSGMPALLVPEAIVTVVGLLSLWAIWALRDRPDQDGVLATEPGLPPVDQQNER
jgi:uncharacterized membrane protein YhfC